MSTSAGIDFKTTANEAKKMRYHLSKLDKITNSSGYGYACSPSLFKIEGHYCLIAQTHWDYTGKERGRPFVREVLKWIKKFGFKIKILKKFYT